MMKTKTKLIRTGLTIIIIIGSFIGFAHETDTLKCNLTLGTPTIYPAPVVGYISGNNNFGDLEIAQKYGIDTMLTDCATVDSTRFKEVAVWFATKDVGINDSVRIKIYNVHPVTGAPDQLLSTSFPIPVSVVDTSTIFNNLLEEFVLQTPIYLRDSFFVSVLLPVGDVVGIISNTDGEGQGQRLGWVKQSSGVWSDVLTLRSLNIDFAIFPKTDKYYPIGIQDEKNDLNQILLYPNPINDNFILKVESEQNINSIEMIISDNLGKTIKNIFWNPAETKKKEKRIDTSTLPSGVYYYSIIANKEYGNGKFVVVK